MVSIAETIICCRIQRFSKPQTYRNAVTNDSSDYGPRCFLMAGLEVFQGDAKTPVLKITEGLWWFLNSRGFDQFTSETGIMILQDAQTKVELNFLPALSYSLAGVVADLRCRRTKYVTEVGLDETRTQITAFETTREDAIRTVVSLIAAAREAYDKKTPLYLIPNK